MYLPLYPGYLEIRLMCQTSELFIHYTFHLQNRPSNFPMVMLLLRVGHEASIQMPDLVLVRWLSVLSLQAGNLNLIPEPVKGKSNLTTHSCFLLPHILCSTHHTPATTDHILCLSLELLNPIVSFSIEFLLGHPD